ncbi:MAG: FecR family protein [Bacteroidales bacterium]
MKNNDIDKGINLNELKKAVAQSEPHLMKEEKEVMWREIEQLTIKKHRLSLPLWVKYAAILIFMMASGATIITINRSVSPFERMANLVQTDTLRTLTLYIGGQRVELADNVDLTCLPNSNQIDISAYGKSLFKLSAPSGENTYMQIAVPRGKKTDITLADNSRVTVREGSKLTFPLRFKGKKRHLFLEGEAFLKVAKDNNRSFITETKDLEIAVLGTEFLVSAYPCDTESSVLLLSGKVQVKPVEGESTILLPNEMFRYKRSDSKITKIKNVDSSELLSWREDILLMKNESLSQILERIESIYRIHIVYNPKEMDKVFINGKLDISVSVDELLDRLSRITPIKYRQERGYRIVESCKNNN